MKAVVAAFNQEKALVGAFSVITNLRMELFEALDNTQCGGDKELSASFVWNLLKPHKEDQDILHVPAEEAV